MKAAERVARLVNTYGVPLLLVFFIAIYFGWITSPLQQAVQANYLLLKSIEAKIEIIKNAEENQSRDLVLAVNRLTDVLKYIDCGDIKNDALRERCMKR